jgi:phage tail protein X
MQREFITSSGDTWDGIALKTMGDEAFTGALIDANPNHAWTVVFSAGVRIVIPPTPAPPASDNLPPWRRNS